MSESLGKPRRTIVIGDEVAPNEFAHDDLFRDRMGTVIGVGTATDGSVKHVTVRFPRRKSDDRGVSLDRSYEPHQLQLQTGMFTSPVDRGKAEVMEITFSDLVATMAKPHGASMRVAVLARAIRGVVTALDPFRGMEGRDDLDVLLRVIADEAEAASFAAPLAPFTRADLDAVNAEQSLSHFGPKAAEWQTNTFDEAGRTRDKIDQLITLAGSGAVWKLLLLVASNPNVIPLSLREAVDYVGRVERDE